MSTVQQEIGIQPGQTREDYKFSLERVACFGACALAPVMVVDDAVYGRMSPGKARQTLSRYLEEPAKSEQS
jgi:NADH-quinone oxidoreductase subunit E